MPRTDILKIHSVCFLKLDLIKTMSPEGDMLKVPNRKLHIPAMQVPAQSVYIAMHPIQGQDVLLD